MKKLLIGLTSVGSKCGKSTLAAHLKTTHKYRHLKMSSPFKFMLGQMFGMMGYSAEDVARMLEGDLKHLKFDKLGGKSPVDLMISLGQNWGRGLVHADLWLNIMASSTQACLDAANDKMKPTPAGVVFDDIRQMNEVSWLKRWGGILIRVHRRDVPVLAIDDMLQGIPADFDIYNDSDITTLCQKLDDIIKRVQENPHG